MRKLFQDAAMSVFLTVAAVAATIGLSAQKAEAWDARAATRSLYNEHNGIPNCPKHHCDKIRELKKASKPFHDAVASDAPTDAGVKQAEGPRGVEDPANPARINRDCKQAKKSGCH